jgi:hypothetical protein
MLYWFNWFDWFDWFDQFKVITNDFFSILTWLEILPATPQIQPRVGAAFSREKINVSKAVCES